MNKVGSTIVAYFSLFIVATIPIVFAAVQPWVWSVYSLMMVVVSVVVLCIGQESFLLCSGKLKYCFSVFFIWTLFLCLPVPSHLLSTLSPTRFATLSKALALTASPPALESISYSPWNSLAWWIFLLSLGLFFLVVRDLCQERKYLARLVFIMIAIGFAEAAYGLLQALVPSMGVLWVDHVQAYLGTARGTFINRNNFAGFVEMIWPLALAVTLSMTDRMPSMKSALGSDRLNRQALMSLGIVVLLMALMFTRSRAGIVCGVCGLLTFVAITRTSIRKLAKPTRILLGGAAALFLLYVMTIGVAPIIDRFLAIGEAGSSRLDIWRDSLPIIKDHPLGIGLNTFSEVFAVYNHEYNAGKTVVYAHNDYLQLLVETGWIGMVALVSGYVLFIVTSLRRIRQLDVHRDPFRYYIATGAFSGLFSVSVHSLFDFNLQIPANCLYFVVLMAIVSACSQPTQPAMKSDPVKVQPDSKHTHRQPTPIRRMPI